MSLQGERLSAPTQIDYEMEQLLLALADGSYVLSTPDGVVAECGAGTGALLAHNPEELAGRPVADVLASAGDPAQREHFEALLHGDASTADQLFAARGADGSARSLRCLVVPVPLALGWEFTSLLSELGSRDADSWQIEELRLRHQRALEAVEAVCSTAPRPATEGRLAGILVVIADADAPALTREGVGERMERYREAAREAKEAARRAELGLGELYEQAPDSGELEDLVERAQTLRARLEEAELQAAEAGAERGLLQARLEALQGEIDAGAGQSGAEHERALARLAEAERERDAEREQMRTELGAVERARDDALAELRVEQAERERNAAQLQTAQAECRQALDRLSSEQAERVAERGRSFAQLEGMQSQRQEALARLTAEQAERERVVASLEAEQAERTRALARLAELESERDLEAQRRAAAESHAATALDDRLDELAAERDSARGETEAARVAAQQADAAAAAARADSERVTSELQALRDSIRSEQVSSITADGEITALRAELEAGRGAAEAAREKLNAAQAQTAAAREELGAAQADAAAARDELNTAQEDAAAARGEVGAAEAEAAAARGEQALARGEIAAVRGELDSARRALHEARDELAAERGAPRASPAELQAARAEVDARVRELAEARRELAAQGGATAELRAELTARVAELTAARGEIGARDDELSSLQAALRTTASELDQARAQAAAGSEELTRVRAEIESQRGELASVRGELDDARAGADELRAERDEARRRSDELQGEADRARAAVDAIRAEFSFEPPASAGPGARPLRNPFAPPPKPLGARPAAAQRQPAAQDAPELPACEPGVAAALIGLDGTFQRLDDAFCSLLGCREDELRNARWPSIIDRENLKSHQEIARALRDGELQSADIETIYMHKRGLLVPVEGTVSMHHDAAGGATHYLFRADVRRTSGAPA